MKYKTTIKLITEAKDKNEAMEIAGEYLSGNLAGGVDMKFNTSIVYDNKQRLGIALAIIIIVGLVAINISPTKQNQNSLRNLPGDSLIQPPLKTSLMDNKYSDFKREWQAMHAKETLGLIKK